jgi:hypothetical protein
MADHYSGRALKHMALLPKLPTLVAALIMALAAIPLAAAGAESANGYPAVSYSPLPDCSCFNYCSAETRVYATVAYLYGSANGTTKQLVRHDPRDR